LHKPAASQLALIISLTILGTSVRSLQPHFKVAMETFKPLMTAGGSVSYICLVVMMSRIMVVSLLR